MDAQNLIPNKTAFFLCDIQEKFRPAIESFDGPNGIVEVEASKILGIALYVTEQYPKGLGQTCSELDIVHAKIKREKTKFTMFDDEVKQLLTENKITHVVLFGVEAHVCILQTTIDLIQNGFFVHLVADGCSSRSLTDRLFAFDRMRDIGAIITTHESVLYQLVLDSKHPKFKDIQQLIKIKSPDTGLLRRSSAI